VVPTLRNWVGSEEPFGLRLEARLRRLPRNSIECRNGERKKALWTVPSRQDTGWLGTVIGVGREMRLCLSRACTWLGWDSGPFADPMRTGLPCSIWCLMQNTKVILHFRLLGGKVGLENKQVSWGWSGWGCALGREGHALKRDCWRGRQKRYSCIECWVASSPSLPPDSDPVLCTAYPTESAPWVSMQSICHFVTVHGRNICLPCSMCNK
jgi:hypothetical protein